MHNNKTLTTVFFLTLCILALSPSFFSLVSGFGQALASSAGITGGTAAAQKNDAARVLCNTLGLVTGTAGKAFAAFAIISIGIGFFIGKVSWGLMISVALGIGAMFGAPTIVAAIAGSGGTCADLGTF